MQISSKLLMTSTLLILLSSFSLPEAGRLTIDINNIKEDAGTIWIGIYNSEKSFLHKEKAILREVKIMARGPKKVQINDLPYGTYAVALFHDLNENGEMDRDWLGIPSEPYAFSKRPKSKLRLPRFKEVQFTFSPSNTVLTTRLHKWWE